MSAVESLPTQRPSVTVPTIPRADALPTLCPYLATLDGTWRSASPVREHRCMAVTPPVQLAPEKQRRLCLVADHVTCATYGAAVAADSSPGDRPAGHSRLIARTTPVVLDQGRFDLRMPALRADRVSGQAVLVGVLGIAFAAILIARPSGTASPAGALGADASASPRTNVAAATQTPAPPATDAPSAVPTQAPAPTDGADPSPGPTSAPASATPASSNATYRIRSGDTLIRIAARFGTTARVLAELNDIADPRVIRVGQILRLP